MNEREVKMLAFITGILIKMADDEEIDGNERQSLENIAGELGTHILDEREFRY